VTRSTGRGSAWGALIAGLASVATLPVAIFLTRFSESYDLLHAGFAIPGAAVLGLVAIALARRSRQREALRLTRGDGHKLAVAGRLLGIAGLCLALAGIVALGMYEFLEYWGSRD
jgi:hypothetical protein